MIKKGLIHLCFLVTLTPCAWGQNAQIDKPAPLESNQLSYIAQMAEVGHPEAQMKLGFAFATGAGGLPIDHEKSIYWSKKAAEQGNAKAQFNLGLSYAKGEGVPQDMYKALHWYEKAAAQGQPNAIENVKVLQHLKNSEPTAQFEAMKALAQQGDANAQFHLAQSYQHGINVPKDKTLALKWYKKAAEQNHIEAQAIMADSSLAPKGLNKNSFEWGLKAAKNGHVKAQKALVQVYSDPKSSGPYDLKEAFAWMKTALHNGAVIDQETQDDIALGITYFKSEAEALAQSYIEKYPKAK